ncbi:hypothetical protein B5S27_g2555 [[Candida] boidinii]|nr:hypothetical protein B5S27_g2555 [[Candida] boidinii]
MSNVKFTWPSGPEDVIVTGSFDNWSQSLPLLKQTDGSFEITYPIDLKNYDSSSNPEEKIYFKFIVDGDWKTSDSFEIETDDSDNSNNVIYYKNLVSIKETAKEAIIPESAGLPVPVKELSKPKEIEKEYKPTVMPSTENQQVTLGEPGIVIPENANEIEAFKHVSTLDPKVLNEPETEIIAAAPAGTTPEEVAAAAADAIGTPTDAPTDIVAEEITDTTPVTAPATAASEAISETSSKKTKKVKKVYKKIKKAEVENENGDAAVVTSTDETAKTSDVKTPPVTASSKTASTPSKTPTSKKTTPTADKKEKKKSGFFSKIKKALT